MALANITNNILTDSGILVTNLTPTSRTITINGVTYDLSADRSWTIAAGLSGSGTANQLAYWDGTSSVTGSATLTYSPTSELLVNNSVTAASGIARGTNLTPTLVAAANGQALVGLDINPTFNNGAFTGVSNIALRVNGIVTSTINFSTQYATTGVASYSHYLELISTSSTNGYVNFRRNGGANGIYAYQLNNGASYFSSNNNTGETSLYTSAGGFFLNFYSGGTEAMRIFSSTRNVLIQNGGTFTDAGYRLDVNGTARFTGNARGDLGFIAYRSGYTTRGISIGTLDGTNPCFYAGVGSTFIAPLYFSGDTASAITFQANSGIGTTPANSDIAGGIVLGGTNRMLVINAGNLNEYIFRANASIITGGSITAASAIARGVNITNTLVAAANNDVLVGLDINPTFNNGAFTSVRNYAARFNGNISVGTKGQFTTYTGANYIFLGNSSITGLNGSSGGDLSFLSNAYYNGTNVVYAASTNFATGFALNQNGTIQFYVAPSGAAGTTVTLTQAAQIFNSGNLLVGTGSTDAGFRLDVNGTARVQSTMQVATTLTVQRNQSVGDVTLSLDNSGSISNWKGSIAYRTESGGLSQRLVFNSQNSDVMSIFGSGGRIVMGLSHTTSDLVASAALAILSTTYGFLPPKMTTAQKNAIASPVSGLMVYDTTLSGIAVYNGTNWQNVLVPNSNNNVLIGTTTDNGQGTLQNTGSAFLGGLQVGGLTFSTSTTATTSTIFYYFNGGSGQTLTLPSTVGISSYFLIKNAGTAALTISRSGSTDTIMAPNGTSTTTTISLAVGSQAILVSNGAFVWIQIV